MEEASVHAADNPLLSLSGARGRLPFDAIRAHHVQPALSHLIAEARNNLYALAHSGISPTWGTVYQAMEAATEPLELAYAVVAHLEAVRTTPELRAAYNATKPEVSAFFASIPLDESLHARLQQYSKSDEARRLPPDRSRALKRTLDEFRRQGAGLEPHNKQRLEAMSRELAAYTAKFAQNVMDETASWARHITDPQELAGLPETALKAARAVAESRGQKGWVLTLHAPSFVPALTYLDNAGLREELYRAYYARASGGERNNTDLVSKILILRQRQARLLGYDNYVDYILEPRMAKSSDAARTFVRDLAQRTRPAFEREKAELQAFRRSIEGEGAPALRPWDIAYYAEKLRRQRFDFDEEALRPYFEVGRVVKGLFEIAEKLFGIQISPNPELPVWHKDVKAFSVLENSEVLGHFYVDLYPRDEKRGGAWMHGLTSGVLVDGQLDRPHLGLFAANITPSIGGQPALLAHSEVQTLFHEFGHLLHHLLSRVEVRSQAGTRVAWDFVELPSQILENWCWSREALDLFARHFETEEPIPDSVFAKMTEARSFRAATAMMRQLGFAEVDLALHLDFDPTFGESNLSDVPHTEEAGGLSRADSRAALGRAISGVSDPLHVETRTAKANPVEFAQGVLEKYSPSPYYDGWAFINGFTHLFASATGYAAGYYSYKWAEVLDADAFTRFKANVFDSKAGQAFRREILEKGDSDDPALLFRRFMGREPHLDALLNRSGLLIKR